MSVRDEELFAFMKRHCGPGGKIQVRVTYPEVDHVVGEHRHRMMAVQIKGHNAMWVTVERDPETYPTEPAHTSYSAVQISGDRKTSEREWVAWEMGRSLYERLQEKRPIADGKPVGPTKPPRAAEFTLLLIPKKNREHLIGDLEEEYRTIMLPEYGRFRARLWYWEQTAIALGYYVWPVIKRILGLAAIWKVLGG